MGEKRLDRLTFIQQRIKAGDAWLAMPGNEMLTWAIARGIEAGLYYTEQMRQEEEERDGQHGV